MLEDIVPKYILKNYLACIHNSHDIGVLQYWQHGEKEAILKR